MTAQIYEQIVYQGEQTSMAFCPPLPVGHPRLFEIDREEAMRDPDNFAVFSTACWREYVGTWEVRDGRFYLAAVRGKYRLDGKDPILADWFSGVLRIPRGERLLYVHMGFGSVYEQQVHVKVENGIVTGSRVVDNRDKDWNPGKLGWRKGGERLRYATSTLNSKCFFENDLPEPPFKYFSKFLQICSSLKAK